MMGRGAELTSASGDLSWVAGFVIIVTVVAALVFTVGWIADRRGADDEPPFDSDDLDLDPIEVLRMRYAYGEIGHDEFIVAKRTVESADQL